MALAEMCFGHQASSVGCAVDLPWEAMAGHLFGEAQSRIIVAVADGQLAALQSLCSEHDVPLTVLGTTGGDRLTVSAAGEELVNEEISALRDVYEATLPAVLQ